MRWRHEILFVLLSLLSILCAVLAGERDERALDLIAVVFAALGLFALRPARSRF